MTLQNLAGKNKNLGQKAHCYHHSFPMTLKYPVGYQYLFLWRRCSSIWISLLTNKKLSQIEMGISLCSFQQSTFALRLNNFAGVVDVRLCRAPSSYRGNSSICIRKWRDFPLEFYSYCPLPDFPIVGKYKPDGDISTSSIYWNREEWLQKILEKLAKHVRNKKTVA